MEFETPAEDRTELADRQHQTLAAELAGARVFFGLHNLFEPIEELQFEDDRQLKRQTQDTASVLEFCAAGGVMQAKMANADKAIGKNMREKTADKLRGGEVINFSWPSSRLSKYLKVTVSFPTATMR